MKFIYFLLSIILLSSCNNKSESKKSESIDRTKKNITLYNLLVKSKQFPQSRLNIKPLNEIDENIVRIWRFPGGGGIFIELYEANIHKQELTQYSILSHNLSKQEKEREIQNLSELEFVNKIKNKKLLLEISELTYDNSLLEIMNSNNYCEGKPGCRDVYLVEYKKGKFTNTFEIDSSIKECNKEKSKKIKYLYSIIEKIVEEYGN
jgi:hypothetical protein